MVRERDNKKHADLRVRRGALVSTDKRESFNYINIILRWDFTPASSPSPSFPLSLSISQSPSAIHYAFPTPFSVSEPAQRTSTKWNSFVCLQMLIEHIMSATQNYLPSPISAYN